MWLRRLLLLLLLLASSAIFWAYWIARSALPQLDGSIHAAGLQQRVTVARDPHGVPTIDAANLPDLFFAQGYVTAQDRLWQMDVLRRCAEGDLAEAVGADGLDHDKQQRILGIREAARRAAEALSPRDRAYFDAYVRGVNTSMEVGRKRLPIEFRILRYSPRPWTIEDSFAIGAELVEELNHYSYRNALLRERFESALGPQLTADLFVNTSQHDHPPAQELSKDATQAIHPTNEDDPDNQDQDSDPVASLNYKRLCRASIPARHGGTNRVAAKLAPLEGAALESAKLRIRARLQPCQNDPKNDRALAPEIAEFNTTDDLRPGSNDWVVSGAHTVSGKPLLSNDMHLNHQMPNLWYEAHLRSGDFDVVGVTLPGVPFVVVGHNAHIAWGFTNVGPTVEDLYIENFNQAGKYETPQGWRDAQHSQEIIHVKNGRDVLLDVVVTRHGPIISSLIPGEARKLSLRWTLYDSFNDPFFDVNAAHNWNEFRQALSAWGAPAQNVVYADIDGHIGYQATGRIPIRAAGDGALPAKGSDNSHEWTGYVPFEKLPSVFDPPSGVLATANSRIAPDGYTPSLSTNWDAPWRTQRIYRVLNSGKKLAPPDMLALETDVESAFDRACADKFVQALDHSTHLTDRSRIARDLLHDWNGQLNADSAAATIEIRARTQLMRLLLEPKLRSLQADHNSPALTWQSYHWSMSSIWIENVLSQQPKRWLPERFSSYDELLAAAVEAALQEPDAPKDLNAWRWGNVSPIELRHPVLGHLPLVGRWTAPGLHDQSGGSYTVKQVGRAFGPSERFTADFSNFDQSTLNTVTGQAGNFLSPHYQDQWTAWYEGHTFTLPFSKAAVQQTKIHELILEP